MTPNRAIRLAVAAAIAGGFMVVTPASAAACGRTTSGRWTAIPFPTFPDSPKKTVGAAANNPYTSPGRPMVPNLVETTAVGSLLVSDGETILRSTDLGCTWTNVFSLTAHVSAAGALSPAGVNTLQGYEGFSIRSLAAGRDIRPGTADTIYGIVSGNGVTFIAASVNDGVSWELKDTKDSTGGPARQGVTSARCPAVRVPGDPSTLHVRGTVTENPVYPELQAPLHFGRQTYGVTTDGTTIAQRAWTLFSSHCLGLSETGRTWVFGASVFRSASNASKELEDVPPPLKFEDEATGVYGMDFVARNRTSPETIVVAEVTAKRVYYARSRDGGRQWTIVGMQTETTDSSGYSPYLQAEVVRCAKRACSTIIGLMKLKSGVRRPAVSGGRPGDDYMQAAIFRHDGRRATVDALPEALFGKAALLDLQPVGPARAAFIGVATQHDYAGDRVTLALYRA